MYGGAYCGCGRELSEYRKHRGDWVAFCPRFDRGFIDRLLERGTEHVGKSVFGMWQLAWR